MSTNSTAQRLQRLLPPCVAENTSVRLAMSQVPSRISYSVACTRYMSIARSRQAQQTPGLLHIPHPGCAFHETLPPLGSSFHANQKWQPRQVQGRSACRWLARLPSGPIWIGLDWIGLAWIGQTLLPIHQRLLRRPLSFSSSFPPPLPPSLPSLSLAFFYQGQISVLFFFSFSLFPFPFPLSRSLWGSSFIIHFLLSFSADLAVSQRCGFAFFWLVFLFCSWSSRIA